MEKNGIYNQETKQPIRKMPERNCYCPFPLLAKNKLCYHGITCFPKTTTLGITTTSTTTAATTSSTATETTTTPPTTTTTTIVPLEPNQQFLIFLTSSERRAQFQAAWG